MKAALITGVSGQDGAYLTQLLLDKGYNVFGAYQHTSSVNFWRMQALGVDTHPNLKLVEYDLQRRVSVPCASERPPVPLLPYR